MAEARATLYLEVIRSDYQGVVDAAAASTAALVAAQAQVIASAPKVAAARNAESAAAKQQTDAMKAVEKAYVSALAPHEKTRKLLEEIQEIRFDDVESTSKQAVAIAHLSDKLDDQTRRFEANRGSQNKLSRSLAELLDEQTKAQTAAIAAGAALLKEGQSSDKLAAALTHLKATTEATDKRTDAYAASVAGLEKQLQEVTAAEKAQTRAQEESAKAFKASAERLDSVEKALQGLHVPGATIIGDLKNLSESFAKIEAGGAGAATFAAGAIAITGVAAAAAAAAAAVIGIGSAIVGAVAAADDWNEELAALGWNLDAIGTEKVNAAAASIDAVGSAAKVGGVALATVFGPSMQAAATQLVALELAGIDAFNTMASGTTAVDILAEAVATGLVESVFVGVTALEKFAEVILKFPGSNGVIGTMAKGLVSLREEIQDLKDDAIAGLTERLKEQGEEGWTKLTAYTADYMALAEELVGAQKDLNDETRRGTTEAEEYADALKRVNEVQDRLNVADNLRIEAIAETMGAEADAGQAFVDAYDLRIDTVTDFEDDVTASIQRITAKELRSLDERRKAQQSYARTVGAVLQNSADAAVGLINLVGGETDKSARRAFAVTQAAAVGSAVVNTFVGITSALAEPVPTPIKYANAIAIGVAGAASVAGILATSFGGGGGSGFSVSAPGGASSSAGTVGSSSGGQGFSDARGQYGVDPQSSNPGGKGSLPGSDSGGTPTKNTGGDIPVTDAYIGRGMAGRTVRPAEGDMLVRSGALGRSTLSDPKVIAELRMQREAQAETNGLLRDFVDLLRMQNYQAAIPGPPRSR